VLDFDYQECVQEGHLKISNQEYNAAFLAEIVQTMMCRDESTSGQETWSEEALDFLSLLISKSLEPLIDASKTFRPPKQDFADIM
jgi:hypothetical protein